MRAWSLVLATPLLAMVAVASAEVPSPTLEGPVTGGRGMPFVASTMFDLATVGYEEAEYFISGTATAFTSATPLTADGKWTVAPGDTAAYRTRILVYRPTNPRKFNGTVIVEWLNVSGGLDAAPDWLSGHTELVRQGFAWVGVSAQHVGIDGGPALPGIPPMPLKSVDPVRYGSLVHPGDSFSYDMFSQAGQAIRHPAGTSPLGTLKVRKLIAAGESQSAFRLVTYIDAMHPLAGIYDGFLVHSRGSGGAPLSEAPQPVVLVPTPTLIRDDLHVPVLTFETETDVALLGFCSDCQDDSARLRLWEVAGTAHVDAYALVVAFTDLGNSPDAAKLIVTSSLLSGLITCPVPVNSGPQHFVLDAAFDALNRWVRRGTPPPRAARFQLAAGAIQRDAHGNALGGIRTSEVDAPIATLSGVGQTGSVLCLLFGTTTPFDSATLRSLYPTHDAYVSAVARATRRAVRARFVLGHDGRLIKTAAGLAEIP